MDKRISKTKRNLKNTLKRLLRRKSLSSITVTELCKDAETSRITFYAHYNDKYDLADEMVRDIVQDATENYSQLQQQNNPQGLSHKTIENTVDTILDSFDRNIELLSSLSPKDSIHLKKVLYDQIVLAVTQRLQELLPNSVNAASCRRYALFVCAGLNEFMNESIRQQIGADQLRQDCKNLSIKFFDNIQALYPSPSGG